MTTEDKVRALAERIRTSAWKYDDLVDALTTFSLDQQRVGAERMRPHLGWALGEIHGEMVTDLNEQRMCCYCGSHTHQLDRISHQPNCPYNEAIRALEPIPAPGKGEV